MNIENKALLFSHDFVRNRVMSGKEWSFRTVTGSMSPIISSEDSVVVSKCSTSGVKPGDILLFERDSSLVVHRLLKIINQCGKVVMVPKADRAYTEEGAFTEKELIGRVVRIQKKLFTIYLDKWHGKAINGFFDMYQLFRMKAYSFKSSISRDFSSPIRPEDKLICLCSVAEIDRDSEEEISRIVSAQVDWDYFMRRLKGEDTASLVYRILKKIDGIESFIPLQVQNHIKDFYYFVTGRNISLLQSLEQVSFAFEKENLSTMVFKGLALAGGVYNDIGLRPMGDIDLLIKKEDILKADRILRGLGFTPAIELKGQGNITEGQYRNSIVYGSEGEFPVSMHVHWHVVNFVPFHENVLRRIDMNRLWEESVITGIGFTHVRTLSYHHHIIYLSMHALNHSFHPLVRLCDINEFIKAKGEDIDWDRLVRDSVEFNLDKCVYFTLYLVSAIFGTELPIETVEKLKPSRTGFIERTFLASVVRGRPILSGEWLICLGMNESVKDKMKFLWRLVLPPRKDFSLIRKKALAMTGFWDYIERLVAGLCSSFKVMLDFARQVSPKS